MIWFKLKCVLIIVAYLCVNAFAESMAPNNFTFTYSMAMRCKEHLCQHAYSYDTFYQVDSEDRTPKTDGVIFEMHLAILASSNGHILLSTIPHPDARDPVYEIVVGGGANKFTELRRNLRRNARTSVTTVGILSAIEFRAFYIRITEDGVISFGREGDAIPLLTYTDGDPLTIKYFSFAAWNGVEAKFLYDCPAPGSNDASPESKEVEPKLSNSENLKRTLLMDKLPNTPPGPTVDVKLDAKVTSVSYNAYESKLTTGLAIVVVWTDDSMAWNPSKFNGTTSLTFRQGQIWRPTFFVFNSDDMGIIESKNTELITMVNSGEATFHFQSQVLTWCHDLETINRWPNDEYECLILIGAWEPHEKITLKGLGVDHNKMNMYADLDEVVQNEWDMEVDIRVVPISIWKTFFSLVDNQTHQSDRLLVTINLKRRGSAYNVVFYTPLIVLVSFVLLSFWDPPLQMSRVWLYAGCTIVLTMGLCYVDFLVPCHSIPTILILYVTVMMGVLIALLIQVTLMTSVVERLCKTAFLQNMLTAKWFRTMFCLPVMKTCKNYESFNEAYNTEEDDDSGVIVAPRNGPVEEMQTEVTKYGGREELAEAFDKLLFAVYSVTFAVMLGLHY